jgi:hypothetical protein
MFCRRPRAHSNLATPVAWPTLSPIVRPTVTGITRPVGSTSFPSAFSSKVFRAVGSGVVTWSDCPRRDPLRQRLLARERDHRLGPLLGSLPVPAELMDPTGTVQSKDQAMRVRQLLSQGEHFITSFERLIRVAEQPENPRRIGEAKHSRIVPIESHMRAVLLGIIVCYPLLQVRSGWDQLSKPKQGLPHRPVRLHEEHLVLRALGQGKELFPQILCQLELPAYVIKQP